MFKKGDFVKLKPKTKLVSGEIVNNWAGKVQEVFLNEKTCLITLDAQTVDSFDDAYLISSIDEGAEPYEYIFYFDEIELSERRDTDELFMIALDKLSTRMIELEDRSYAVQESLIENWIKEFENSEMFDSLNEIQQDSSNFVISTFMDYMYNYEYVQPTEWRPSNIESVCLDIVPRKITSDEETFENYGEILISYLKFLQWKNYISNAKTLIQRVEKIKHKIPIEARNPNNWGMAKSMMMSAQEQGFDLSSEEGINEFMMLEQMKAINAVEQNNHDEIVPFKENPFKEFGRNQKVTVKYNDGKLVENIKFKKVELDLRNGNCELLKQ